LVEEVGWPHADQTEKGTTAAADIVAEDVGEDTVDWEACAGLVGAARAAGHRDSRYYPDFEAFPDQKRAGLKP
jgi:hypothetical protein